MMHSVNIYCISDCVAIRLFYSLNEIVFVSHFWHNVTASARGFWIYLHFTERREWRDATEPAHNQHVHVFERVKEWHSCCLLSDRLTEEYVYFLKSTFSLMFSCNTGAINEARERALKSEAWINYRLTDELGLFSYAKLQTFKGRCL